MKEEINSRQKERESQEIDKVPPGAGLFDYNAKAIQEKRSKQKQIFKRVEPDKREEEKPAQQKLSFGENRRKSENPEDDKRKKRDKDFRIDMDGIKEDGGGEAENKPESEGKFFIFPLFSGIEEHLEAEESAKKTYPEAEEENETFSSEKRAQGIKGEYEKGDARRMKRIKTPGFCSRNGMGPDEDVGKGEFGVIPLRIIVSQVKIPILQKAVRDEKIMGLVTGESDPLAAQENRACVGEKQSSQEEHGEFLR